MNFFTFKGCLVLLVTSATFHVVGAEHRIECPSEIPRKSIHITSAPDGWTAFVPFEFQPGLPLHSAGLMLGPPATMTISRPTSVGTMPAKGGRKGRGYSRWEGLAREDYGPKWMACYYGEGGQRDAILSRKLDDRTTECTVIYPLDKSSNAIDIVCTW